MTCFVDVESLIEPALLLVQVVKALLSKSGSESSACQATTDEPFVAKTQIAPRSGARRTIGRVAFWETGLTRCDDQEPRASRWSRAISGSAGFGELGSLRLVLTAT